LALFGIVWDLKPVPRDVREARTRVRPTPEKQ